MIDFSPNPSPLSSVLVHLFRGVLYSDSSPELWQSLLTFQARVRDYLSVIGLEVVIDESEGYGYLRQIVDDSETETSETQMAALPRLIPRRPLSFPLSLLCVLLRRKLAEQDAGGGETRLILNRDQIIDSFRVYLPDANNEVRMIDLIDQNLNKLVDYGLLRKLKGENDVFEVRRIVKAGRR
jgi:hypothetical protein